MEPMSMLNVLAEIASEKLQTDPTVMITKAEKQNSVIRKKSPVSHQQNQGKQMTLVQVSALSESTILRLFTVSQANELKRKFYFTCRLIPLQCEETFHSFGSEDKAQNLMKKHLKEHLHELLEMFKDQKSQENYILHTVQKSSKNIYQDDFKSISKKQCTTNKSELKSKFSNEMEKSSIDVRAENENHITCSKFNITSSNSSIMYTCVSSQSHVPILPSESLVQMSLSSRDPYTVSEDRYNVLSNVKCSPVYINSVQDQKNQTYDSVNRQSASSVKRRLRINTSATKNESILKHKINRCLQLHQNHTAHPVITDFDLAICDTKSSSTEESVPSVSYMMDGNCELSASQQIVQNSNFGSGIVDLPLHSRCNSVLNCGGVIEIVPNKATEVTEVKMEVLGMDQQYKMDEKEIALTLIDKFKSQPIVQNENFQCNICKPPRIFTAHSTLVSHYKSHAGIRPYVCSLCQAVFTRQHSLNYHLLIHYNQTRFTCDDCGRKFRHPSHFKEHRRRHTGESPYECKECFMRFKTRNTYKRHLRTRHGKKLTTKGLIYSVTEDSEAPRISMKTWSNKPYGQESRPSQKTAVDIRNKVGSIGASNSSLHVQTNQSRTGIAEMIPTEGNELCRHPGNIKYPEMIPFISEISLYNNRKEQSESSLFRLNIKKDDPTIPPPKQYHELMPLEIPIINRADDCNKWSYGLSPSSPSSRYAGNCAQPIPCSQMLHDTQGGNSLSTISFQQAEQQRDSAISLKNADDGILFIIRDGGLQSTPFINVGSDGLLSHAVNNSAMTFNELTPQVDEVNDLQSRVLNSLVFSEENSVVLPCENFPHVVQPESKTILPSRSQSSDERSAAKGSILNSLLTSGSDLNHFTTHASLQPPLSLRVEGDTSLTSNKTSSGPNGNTEKWDSFIRKVVSLSSAVKMRPEPLQEALSLKTECVINDYNDKNIATQTEDSKEVYVLKCVEGSFDNRVVKVFNAKPLFATSAYEIKIPVEFTNNPKPILITSSVRHCDRVVDSTPSGSLDALP